MGTTVTADGRSWLNNEACFTSMMEWCLVQVDETDLLELGPRPAVAVVRSLIEEYYHRNLYRRYRRP